MTATAPNLTGYGSTIASNGNAATQIASVTPQGVHEAPTIRKYRQLPVNVPLVSWNVDSVYEAINAHENGLFQQSSILHDAMMRDDCYAGRMQTRVQTAIGIERRVKLSEKSDAEEARVALEQEAPSMLPRSVRAQLAEWRVSLGFAIAQVVKTYDADTERWHHVLEPWHPSYVYYRLDIDSYQLISYGGIVDIGHGIPGEFVVFEPLGRRSWMGGTIRSLGLPWLGRNYALQRDWPRLLELYALGIRKAIVPPNADIKKKGPFLRQVAALGAETTIVVEQGLGDGEPKYDLEILAPPVANNGAAFDLYVNRIEDNVSIRLLGNNLTSKASAKSSSGAAAATQHDVQDDIVAADLATDAETETAQLFRPWLADHYGPVTAAAITSTYATEKEDTSADKVDAWAKLGPTLPMYQAAGADVVEMMRDLDIPIAPNAPALPTLPAPVAPPPASGATAPASPATQPESAKSDVSAKLAESLAKVALSAEGGRPLTNPRLVRHAVQAQQLLDEWHDEGASDAAGAPQSLVRQIVTTCQNVSGFDKLAEAVLALYAKRSVSRDLVDTVHTARVRARLLGRLAVIREGSTNGGAGRRRIGRGTAQGR